MENESLEQIKAYFNSFSKLTKQSNTLITPEKISTSKVQDFFHDVSPLHQKNLNSGSLINVWTVSGIKRNEVRNTAVLAWWLDCHESHGLGSQLLTRVLNDHMPKFNTLVIKVDPYRTRPESLPLGELDNRIDIEMSSRAVLIFWEVKIDAQEGKEQLNRYHTLLNAKANKIQEKCLIYLTPDSGKQHHSTPYTYGITWSQLANSFRDVLESIPEENLSKALLFQYCEHISTF
ncbi:PD-(D/E)XK nuclease family protein [Vibrio splendidus]